MDQPLDVGQPFGDQPLDARQPLKVDQPLDVRQPLDVKQLKVDQPVVWSKEVMCDGETFGTSVLVPQDVVRTVVRDVFREYWPHRSSLDGSFGLRS
jgi:hypothetical protein